MRDKHLRHVNDPARTCQDGCLPGPRPVFHSRRESLAQDNLARPIRMKIKSFQISDVFFLGQTQDLASRMIEIECAPVGIRADHDVWRRLEDGSETVVRCFCSLPLANFALKRIHLFLQLPLGTLQCVVLGLDLDQHLIEGVGQDPDLVATHFVGAHGVVLVVCDRARGARQAGGSDW